METRTERYQKYRSQILSLPDAAFASDGSYIEVDSAPSVPSSAPAPAQIPNEPMVKPAPAKKGTSPKPSSKAQTPYTFYLSQRKTLRIVKLVISAVLLIGLALFFVFFVGGPQS